MITNLFASGTTTTMCIEYDGDFEILDHASQSQNLMIKSTYQQVKILPYVNISYSTYIIKHDMYDGNKYDGTHIIFMPNCCARIKKHIKQSSTQGVGYILNAEEDTRVIKIKQYGNKICSTTCFTTLPILSKNKKITSITYNWR